MRNTLVAVLTADSMMAPLVGRTSRDLRGDYDRALIDIAYGGTMIFIAIGLSTIGVPPVVTLPMAVYGLRHISIGVASLNEVKREMARLENAVPGNVPGTAPGGGNAGSSGSGSAGTGSSAGGTNGSGASSGSSGESEKNTTTNERDPGPDPDSVDRFRPNRPGDDWILQY
jgi:uncharacterized membrane protein YgcG